MTKSGSKTNGRKDAYVFGGELQVCFFLSFVLKHKKERLLLGQAPKNSRNNSSPFLALFVD